MTSQQNYQPDNLDIAILEHLQKNGRMAYSEIGTILGISANTVRNRVNNMLENEVMSFTTLINPQKVGYRAYVAIFIAVDPPHVEQAAQEIAEFPEVIWLAETTGMYNLNLDVVCRDISELHEFINNRLHQVIGVKRTDVVFYMKYHKLSTFSLLLRTPGNDSPTSPIP
jgi:Lrp/AsnC family transcriptional regulator for asnA, asnC and gidA